MAQTEKLTTWEESKLAEFFGASDSFRATTTPYLAVAALKGDGQNAIISARLVFASPTASVEERRFESRSLLVFLTKLADVQTAEALIESAISGSFEFAGEPYVLFPRNIGGGGFNVEPFNETMGAQMRLCALSVKGRETASLFDFQHLDWELRASEPPYLSFGELLSEFGLSVASGYTSFEAYHTSPVLVDRDRSALSGTDLTVSIRLERGLPIDEVQVALVAIRVGEAAVRKIFRGNELGWEQDGEIQLGTLQWKAPAGRAIQAVAIFRGVAFHYWWVVDPQQIPNTRKAVYEVVDADLATLRDFMVASGPKGSARDLESAVAWLLWMLGFSIAHLGANTRTQDAVDILATTPNGNFALVECTTGVISTDKKVANLLSRKAVVLERLARASHNQVRVLPVIVTSKGRDEVVQEIQPAQERGVLVLTRDDLVDLLNRTDMLPDADQLYSEAEKRLAGSVETEPTLPGV